MLGGMGIWDIADKLFLAESCSNQYFGTNFYIALHRQYYIGLQLNNFFPQKK